MRAAQTAIYSAIGLIIAVGWLSTWAAPGFLERYYLVEDGILEWLTVGLFVFLAGLCVRRALRLASVRPALFTVSLTILALACLFVAGEEISWGQRILSIETPAWLAEHNQQGEMTIHNLVIGGVSINKIVFGQIITAALIIYMFAVPWLADRSSRLTAVVDHLGLPLPTLVQALVFAAALFLPVLLIASPRIDEMSEACGTLALVGIFLAPKNGHIYARDRQAADALAD